jgi:membrane-bound lytic murein transglycosylase
MWWCSGLSKEEVGHYLVEVSAKPRKSRSEKQWDTWFAKYEMLVAFKKANDHLVVTQNENNSLYRWITNQRQNAKKGKLSNERRNKLEEIDFPFQCVSKYKKKNYTPQQVDQWEKMYTQLEEYHKAKHDCLVPYNYEPNPTLGHWVSKQRADYKMGVMGQE